MRRTPSSPFNFRNNETGWSYELWLQETAEDNSEQMMRLKRNLRECIETDLTARQRQIVKMKWFRGMSVTGIACELGVNKGTVSRTLKRAQERIRYALRYSL